MKKIFVLIALLVFCILCLTIDGKEKQAVPVSDINDYNYYVHDIDVSEGNVTTKNIYDKFNRYTILSIEPEINPIYQKNIKIKSFHFDQSKSIDNNIKEFLKIYSNILQKQSFNDEVQKIEYNGVKISTICLYITNNQLEILLDNNGFKLIN